MGSYNWRGLQLGAITGGGLRSRGAYERQFKVYWI